MCLRQLVQTHLSVIGHTDGIRWEIRITDNGGGFSQEALAHLSDGPTDAVSLEINGLGLKNTFSRLCLYLGDDFSYHVENLTQGSRITLKGVFKND